MDIPNLKLIAKANEEIDPAIERHNFKGISH